MSKKENYIKGIEQAKQNNLSYQEILKKTSSKGDVSSEDVLKLLGTGKGINSVQFEILLTSSIIYNKNDILSVLLKEIDKRDDKKDFLPNLIAQYPKFSLSGIDEISGDLFLEVADKYMKENEQNEKMVKYIAEHSFFYLINYPDFKLAKKMLSLNEIMSKYMGMNYATDIFQRQKNEDNEKDFEERYKIIELVKEKIDPKRAAKMLVDASYFGHPKLFNILYPLTDKKTIKEQAVVMADNYEFEYKDVIGRVLSLESRFDAEDLRGNLRDNEHKRKVKII